MCRMKNLFRVLAAAALIVLAASCARETNSDSISDYFRKYNLSFSEATKTELSGTGNKRQVNWGEGDEIKYYTVSKQASAASATVNVNGSNAYVQIPRGRSDEFINAVYGASQLKSSSSTADVMYISSPIKNAQSYKSFSAAHVCVAFSDDIEAPNLSFHNIPAVFKFTSVASISKVVFYGNKDEIINAGKNGDLKITSSGGALSVESAATGSNASNQTSVTVATKGAVADFFIAILPVNFSAGITVDCYDTDSELVFSLKTTGALNTVSGSGAPKILDLGNAQDWIASAPPTAIDLGLSVKWASFNVGATSPDGYGDYFAWGETAPKAEYKWVNYQLGSSKNGPFSKYVLDAQYGTVDHKTVLDLTDDAAYVAWGGDWRMPTKEEVAELMNTSNCTWTWTTKNGVPGYKVTSRKSGYTANSIFLPANGMKSGSSLSDGGIVGNYWTSSISASYPYYAISPFFDSSSKNSDNCYRYFGLGVRPVQGAVVPVLSISIPETLTLLTGASETLSVTVLPENATFKNVTWTSTDESIATVDANGKVTAVAPGTATIIAYSADGGITATCVVSSIKLAESVTLDKTAVEMFVGDEPITLTATILPETTTDKTVSWTSSKTTVATVDEEGRVTAVANGTATITATAKDGSGKSATCSVTVKTHVESVSLNKTKLTLYEGRTATLIATVTPSTATDKSVVWSSSDATVASVDQDGKVTGVKVGTAVITATTVDGAKTATCEVTVIETAKPQAVDLGLPSGLKWASWNVGASAPEEYGDYFAWGETQPKDNYNWSTYKFGTSSSGPFSKYNTSNSYGTVDNKTVLDPEDDAAHVNWGGSWRMPTDAEWTELSNNCTWTWTTQNGVKGRLVTSKTNGNSIFLPAAGYRGGTYLTNVGSYGYCWSSSLYTGYPYRARYVYFNSDNVDSYNDSRYRGFSVRPVSE